MIWPEFLYQIMAQLSLPEKRIWTRVFRQTKSRSDQVKRVRNDGLVVFGLILMISALFHLWLCLDKAQANPMKADKVVVVKSERLLMLLNKGKILKTYTVALGKNPTGRKTCQGDRKTPEGLYVLDRRNARSRYYRSLHISYPNAQDLQNARDLGVSAGSDVMIHGIPAFYNPEKLQKTDWTHGCIAVTNSEIDEIWQLVPDGIPIEIKP